MRSAHPLLALVLLVPAPTLGVLAGMYFLQGPVGQSLYGLSKLWLVALPLIWLLKVDKGRLSWSPPHHGGLVVGAVLGLVIAGLIWLAHVLWGEALIDPEKFRAAAKANGIGTPGRFIGLAIYICTVNALLEEYVWRWFVFRKCESLVPGYPAVVLSAAFFTLHHVFAVKAQFDWGFTIIASAGVFAGGLIWSWCYSRYRSVWPGFVSHVLVDVAFLALGWWILFPAA